MKSAYELAMERLNKSGPTVKVSPEQKHKLAELDSEYAAKMAERELIIGDEIKKARQKGDFETIAQMEKQLVSDRKSLHAKMEEKKESIRQRK